MISNSATARALFTLGLVAFLIGAALTLAEVARSDSTPVGPLPAGPTSTTVTAPGQLVAIALPHAARSSGLTWRLARRYDARVVREVSEADIGANIALVFKVVGRGNTALVFALTKGDASPMAVKSAIHRIRSR